MKKKSKRVLLIVFVIALVWVGYHTRETMTPAVGLLELEGAITYAMPSLETIRDYEEDDHIRAVLVRLDSPGGVVGPSQEIYQALLRLKEKKPVVASLASVGASGAYYIACASDSIYALPGTMTGSIGVIMEFMDVSEGLAKLGITGRTITAGEMKDAGSPLRHMSDKERAYFEALTADVHEQFMQAVTLGRNLPLEQVREISDGRVFTGRQALEMGLVDQLGGFYEALDEAKTRAGIEGEVRIVRREEEQSLWQAARRLMGAVLPFGASSSDGLVPKGHIRLEYSMY